MMKRLFGFVPSTACKSDRKDPALHPDRSSRNGKVIPFERPTKTHHLNMLSDLKIGESAVLVALDLPDAVQNHLMHMGFVPEARVTTLRRAPAGDPTVYGVDGMEIALRHETASAIRIRAYTHKNDKHNEFIEAAR